MFPLGTIPLDNALRLNVCDYWKIMETCCFSGFASAGFIVDSRLDSFAIGLSMGGLGARRAKTAAPPV